MSDDIDRIGASLYAERVRQAHEAYKAERRATVDDAVLRERIAKAIDDARMWALVAGINRDDEDEKEQEAFAMADAILAVIAETHELHPCSA